MKRTQIVSIVLLLFILSDPNYCQETFKFLKLDFSPRAAALGGSFVSNSDDPNVMFYNPAGIGTLESVPVSFSFVKHLMDINLASLAFSREFNGLGRFALGVQYINYGSFKEATMEGNITGEFNAGEFAFILGYSNTLDENFYYGINTKFIYSGIADASSTALAFDLGLQYVIPEQQMTIGASVLNIGGQLKKYFTAKEDLPLDIRVGASKRLEHLPLRLYLSFNKLNDEDDRFKTFTFGGEFNLSKVLRLRLGYDNEKRRDLKIGTTAGLAGFNIGIGALISGYNFDYAYSSWGSIGSLSRIGITTNF